MTITWDHKISQQIMAWGKPQYALWYALAVHLFNIYAVVWVVFGVLGWLNWWTVPVVGFLSWLVTISVQAIIKRPRPRFEETTGYTMWWKTYSLPSGHATISAALATAILLETHWPSALVLVAVAIAFLIVEFFICMGRIVVGVHYLADVLIGFVLGVTFGVVYGVLI